MKAFPKCLEFSSLKTSLQGNRKVKIEKLIGCQLFPVFSGHLKLKFFFPFKFSFSDPS